MDLGNIVQEEQIYTLQLKHPTTGEPVGSSFGIRSLESKAVQAALRQSTDMVLAKREQRIYAQEIEEKTLLRAAASVAWWEWGDNEIDGEKPDYTEENVQRILAKHGWIYEQVVNASSARENFTEGSKP